LDQVLAPFRAALGDRIRLIVSGGAPILKETFEFIRSAITPSIVQGYGLTECSASLAVQEYPEKDPTNVGGITIASECKLRKVPDLNYDPRGSPMCGEILVRGPHIFREYYKEQELTAEALVDGEWLATGDVGKIQNGVLSIIDRVKQLVKLSQREYISVTTLNDLYSMADGVASIFVYADSLHDTPGAVVVPTQDRLDAWKAAGITDVVTSAVARDEILAELQKVHVKYKLMGFQRISAVLLELEEFTVENRLLTPSFKPQWQALRKRYQQEMVNLLDGK
jgi:long-chain acyl-CoA synthetase